MASLKKLGVGYVPEHFSTPLHFAVFHGYFAAHNIEVELLPYPSGTGAMIKALEANELDLAVGLTEGWIAALADGKTDAYKLVGKYVDTPLCWAISAGAKRSDMASASDLAGGKKLGISRFGSGSYVMGYVLAEQNRWELERGDGQGPFDWVVLDNFKNLRDGVNGCHHEGKTADAFMWEHFTSKKYYDSEEIKRIGEIYTPWPSWHIVAHNSLTVSETGIGAVRAFVKAVDEGIQHFNENNDEAVKFIASNLDYSEDDAKEWLKTVKFSDNCGVVEKQVVAKTVDILKKAGVVKKEKAEWNDLVMDLNN